MKSRRLVAIMNRADGTPFLKDSFTTVLNDCFTKMPGLRLFTKLDAFAMPRYGI